MDTAAANAERLTQFLLDEVGDQLRSVIYHRGRDHDVTYVRDDVAARYTDEEVAQVVEDLVFDTLDKHHQEGMYVHGDLVCNVRCFEEAVEIHLVLDEHRGIAISLEPTVLLEHQSFVGRCMEAVGVDEVVAA